MFENNKGMQNWRDEVILTHASLRSENETIRDITFWQNLDAEKRVIAAWQIAKEVHLLRGKSDDELRMDKSKGRVIHRSKAEEPFDPSKDFVFTLLKNRKN
jgi:hypothetical protein